MIKLFENYKSDEEIHEICDKYNISDYTINSDKTVSVNGGLTLSSLSLDKIPLKFKEVTRWVDLDDNNLTSLEGCPDVVGNTFDCGDNRLKSLIGGPKIIGGSYFCDTNIIMIFHGFPEHLGGDFHCGENPIEEIWKFFKDKSDAKDKIELLNEMDPLRIIDGNPHVVIDILNDFLSIIGNSARVKEVQKVKGYINI